jgi:hypothetical protein
MLVQTFSLVVVAAFSYVAYILSFQRPAQGHSVSGSRTAQLPQDSSARRSTTPVGVDVRQVYPTDAWEETDFDIIAIHGLDTRSPDTWTWRDPNNHAGSGINWLSDPTMLPKLFPRAGIYTCDWPASLFNSADSIQSTIEELARSLLLGVQARQNTTKTRPAVFIASCLGGIVLAKALVLAAAPRSEYSPLWRDTVGIIFLATPFRGTAFQRIARHSIFFLKSFAMLSGRRVTSLIDSVGESTPFLEELVASFTSTCLQRGDSCQLSVFYETGKGNLWRKFLPLPIADMLFEQQTVRDHN